MPIEALDKVLAGMPALLQLAFILLLLIVHRQLERARSERNEMVNKLRSFTIQMVEQRASKESVERLTERVRDIEIRLMQR